MTPNKDSKATPKNLEIWELLAQLINQMPSEERQKYRQSMGEFMHDMHHTLGLISNAQDLLRRDLMENARLSDPLRMLDIIKTASERGCVLLNEVIDSFGNQIELSD